MTTDDKRLFLKEYGTKKQVEECWIHALETVDDKIIDDLYLAVRSNYGKEPTC